MPISLSEPVGFGNDIRPNGKMSRLMSENPIRKSVYHNPLNGVRKLRFCCDFRTMLLGYAREATHDQHPRLQIEALKKAGCTKIFTDEGVSGAAVKKSKLIEALAYARTDEDTLVIWKLDRLSRSTRDLIETVEGMKVEALVCGRSRNRLSTRQRCGKSHIPALRCLCRVRAWNEP